ncbi:MAG: type II toxin-antitoxin system HicA family toxin [Chloroflexi bacterium]|nr:type II toxin-antitoxin system HicA family toxin [Chloroflexota bacterium]
MSGLRGLSYQEVTRRLRKLGFRLYRHGKGSHEVWVRDTDGRVIPVPHHGSKAIRTGTMRAIIRETGLSVEEFMGL